MSIVEIKNLKKEYPLFLLDNVAFNLEAGRITGFAGRNGAGKTTTIKSMLNLIHPDSGVITCFGMSLNGHEAEIKRRKLRGGSGIPRVLSVGIQEKS